MYVGRISNESFFLEIMGQCGLLQEKASYSGIDRSTMFLSVKFKRSRFFLTPINSFFICDIYVLNYTIS